MVDNFRFKVENMADRSYTFDTPFIEFLEDLRRIGICGKSREYYEEVYKEHPGLTFGEVLTQFPPRQAWARSTLRVYDGKLDKKLKRGFMEIVTDPVMNYRMWKQLVHVTEEEVEYLHSKFRGKLPNIERNL